MRGLVSSNASVQNVRGVETEKNKNEKDKQSI